MTNHTPGPWHVEPSKQPGNCFSAIMTDTGVTGLASIHLVTKEAHANARLIASAPDLLSALKAIHDVGEEELDDDMDAISGKLSTCHMTAWAAIAKAEGST